MLQPRYRSPLHAKNWLSAPAADSRSPSTGTPKSRRPSVEVHQPATQETIAFTVPDEDALDAFHHPFAHLGRENDQRST